MARQYSGTLGKVGNVQIGVSVHAVTDAGYGEIGYFRTGLSERAVPYVVQVKSSTSVHDAAARFAVPAATGKRGRPFTAARVPPANRNLPKNDDGSVPECWLLIEWPEDAAEPTDYWLSTLPADTPIAELVRLGKICLRIEHDYRELKHGLGLDHFEGRTWAGWHHHLTLVSAAHLFITLQRLGADPKAAGAA